jgi:hypothetical protein
MGFKRFGRMQVLAAWELSQDGQTRIAKTAAEAPLPSFYAQPGTPGTLDIAQALRKVAQEYDISDNPQDYIYEAVRACTAGVANENGDAFSRDELLRFDHRLACAVYQTFILKPHHINHRADNPKTARGVILDSHYNDDAPPMENCPTCNARTAEREGRDRTGLYCRACGTTVHDQFVEILIGVDKTKDPSFAEGVRTGSLNATSMGCVCDSTTCNVCDHVAYNRNEFCQHIKGGNKKKVFKTAAGDRMAFEWCNNVVFTEQSRVDQPADPTALQTEILELSAQKRAAESLHNETEMLKLSKRIVELETKVANIRTADGPEAPPPAPVDDPNAVDGWKPAAPAAAPPTTTPGTPVTAAQGVETEVNEEEDKAEPGTIAAYAEDVEEKKNNTKPFSQDAVGILEGPAPGAEVRASINDSDLAAIDEITNTINAHKGARNMEKFKFKQAYKDLRLQVTKQGGFRIFNPRGTLFIATPAEKIATAKERTNVGMNIMRHIAEHGLVSTIKTMTPALNPKMASILEFDVEDFDGGREKGDTKPVTGDNVDNFTDARATPKKDLQKDYGDDFTDSRATPKTDIRTDVTVNFEGGYGDPKDSVTNEDGLAAREVHHTQTVQQKNTVLDGAESDMQSPDGDKGSPKKNDTGAVKKKGEVEVEAKKPMPAWAKALWAPSSSKGPSASKDPSGRTAEKSKSKSKSRSASKPSASMGKEAAVACSSCKKSKGRCACSKKKNAGVAVPAETKQYESRLERLYKRRFAQLEQEQNKKVAAVVDDVAIKFRKALSLAAARQQLNLEASPIKAAFAETLLAPMDLSGDEYYPGMDQNLAVTLTERAASIGFGEFVDQTVARAAELMKLSDDAFGAIEADVKNLQPVAPPIVENEQSDRRAELARTAARQGNLQVAPAPTDSFAAPRGQRHDRSGIRGALGNTKIHRTGISLKQDE